MTRPLGMTVLAVAWAALVVTLLTLSGCAPDRELHNAYGAMALAVVAVPAFMFGMFRVFGFIEWVLDRARIPADRAIIAVFVVAFITLAVAWLLTSCATIAPNLTVEQQRALFPEADRAQVAAPAPVTLTWTNPSRLPHFESPGQRVACSGGGPASTDTLTNLRDARVYAVPRVLCSPWAAGVPGWPECWTPSPPILLGVFDAVGQEGKRMTVEVAPVLGVATYYVTTTRGRLYAESCESNMVQVER